MGWGDDFDNEEFLIQINNAGAFSKPGTADPDRMDNLDFLYNVNMRRYSGEDITHHIRA